MSTTSTIGTASRNYSTITAWHAAFATGGWIGETYNDTEFNETPSIGGTSAVNYEILRTATGQSAFDTNTNPLKYDQSKGVGLKTTTAYSILLAVGAYCTVQKMQLWNAGGGNNGRALRSVIGAASVVVDRCLGLISASSGGSTCCFYLQGNAAQSLTNFVAITYSHNGVSLDYANSIVVANGTVVTPSDKSAGGFAFNTSSGSPKITNCGGFGFTSGFSNGGTPSGSNNATDQSSISFGSSNLTSLTYANQFVGVTSSAMDFRLKSGSSLIDAGATDTTDIPAAIDIFGTSRPQGSAWDIGAHEYIAAGPAFIAPRPRIISQAVNRASTY